MGPTWGPSGSCRPQVGPMLAPWTLLSGWSCTTSWSIAHLPHMGLPMGQTWYQWGSRLCEMHISETAGCICCNQSSMKFSRYVVVQCHLPHMSLPHMGQNTFLKPLDRFSPCKVLWSCLDMYVLAHGPVCISLKQLEGFSLFEVLCNCPDLWLCNVMGICPFASYGLANWPAHIPETAGQIFFIVAWNCLEMYLPCHCNDVNISCAKQMQLYY